MLKEAVVNVAVIIVIIDRTTTTTAVFLSTLQASLCYPTPPVKTGGRRFYCAYALAGGN